jgi:putative ABC transport system permease protein
MLLIIRQAARRLRHDWPFSAGIVAVLALAIGANTAIFTLVYDVLLKPLPLRDPDRLVSVALVRPGSDRQPLSLPDVDDFKAALRTTDGFASMFGWNANLIDGAGDAERVQGARVSPDYFEVTGTPVAAGRAIGTEDEHRPVVVISHGLWERRFARMPEVIGRPLTLNGESFTIIGVLRPDFVSLVRDPDVVAPYSPASDPRHAERAQGFLWGVARLKPGLPLSLALDDFDAVRRRMRAEFPDAHGTDTGTHLVPLADEISGRAAPTLRMLMAAVTLVLLVASANLANLFAMRASARRREIAVRVALGASRPRIAAHVLAEAVLLTIAGGALGLLAAQFIVNVLLATSATDLPRAAEIGLDVRVASFTFATAIATSLLFGLVPALQSAGGDCHDALKDGARTSTGGGGRLRLFLVFAEVALSTVLLTTAALLARSYEQVAAVDPGFRPAHAMSIRLALPRARYKTRETIEQFYEAVHPRLAALPGVKSVAAANVVPLNGYMATTAFYIDGIVTKNAPDAHYRMISPDYFDALGIPVKDGRPFGPRDRADTAAVAVVNETFARHYLAGRRAVGARMRLDDGERQPREIEIVGVVGDVKHFGLDRESTIEVYVPITQVAERTTIWLANIMYWVLRTDGDPLAAANLARREIAAVDPEVPANFVRSMDQWIGRSLAPRRFTLQLVEAFAAMALLLALVGVYAVAAASAALQTREIGIRAALGGTRVQVVSLMVRRTMVPVMCGLAAGVPGAAFTAQAASGMLFGVTPHDPASIGFVGAAVGCVALAASFIPARRAAAVSPVIALRTEN